MQPFYEVVQLVGVSPKGLAYILFGMLFGLCGHIAATAFIDITGEVARVSLGIPSDRMKRSHWHATHGMLSSFVAGLYTFWTVDDLQQPGVSLMKAFVICSLCGITPVLIMKALVAIVAAKTRGLKAYFEDFKSLGPIRGLEGSACNTTTAGDAPRATTNS